MLELGIETNVVSVIERRRKDISPWISSTTSTVLVSGYSRFNIPTPSTKRSDRILIERFFYWR